MNQKATFKKLFAAMAIILMILPIVVTLSAVLTSLFNQIGWYVALQNYVVPFEARFVAVVLQLVNIKSVVTPDSSFAMLLEKPDGQYLPVILSWNCLGWQSLVLLGLTLAAGLRGNWGLTSKLEVLILGITGTFLVNIMRIAGVTALMFYWNDVAARVMHDYLAALVALIWLIFFWWFSYRFILEEQQPSIQEEDFKV